MISKEKIIYQPGRNKNAFAFVILTLSFQILLLCSRESVGHAKKEQVSGFSRTHGSVGMQYSKEVQTMMHSYSFCSGHIFHKNELLKHPAWEEGIRLLKRFLLQGS